MSSAKVTEVISSQILEVQNLTGKAVEAIGRIARRMGEITTIRPPSPRPGPSDERAGATD